MSVHRPSLDDAYINGVFAPKEVLEQYAAAQRAKPTPGKRKPLLVDRFLASKHNPMLDKRREQAHRDRLRAAKIFALDRDACRYAAEMTLAHPHAIARDIEFAIPTFPNMYVEMTAWPEFYNVVSPDRPWDPATGDTVVGYHIDGSRAYVLTAADTRRETWVMPFVYKLNQPFTLREEIQYAEMMRTSRMGLDEFYWGTMWNYIDNTDRRTLRANHSFDYWYGHANPNSQMQRAEAIALMTRSAAGDLRNIVALMLFLNRTSKLRYDEPVEMQRAMIHSKPSVLLKHSVVRLRLNPKPMFKQLYGGGIGVWRREHDVRGHFCHDKTARDAQHHNHDGHDWREYGVNQWRCALCAGHKWWRKACRRGSKDKGKVKTTYEVTASRERIAA